MEKEAIRDLALGMHEASVLASAEAFLRVLVLGAPILRIMYPGKPTAANQ